MTHFTTRRSRAISALAGLVLVAVLAGSGYGIWYLFLRPAGPPSVDIAALSVASAGATDSPSDSASALPESSASATGPNSTSSAASGDSATSSGVSGTWKVNTSIGDFSSFTDSFVGYRVQEQLGSIGANTAVGRTPNVSGTLTIQGTSVTAVQVSADLTSLQSDDQRRDGQLSRQGLETSVYPTATFTLTKPIDLGSIPADGQTSKVSATGQLTLHGQTRTVTIPLQAKLSSNTIVVTGSLPIVFSDYGIQKPQSFAVLSIADQGTMELQMLFTRS